MGAFNSTPPSQIFQSVFRKEKTFVIDLTLILPQMEKINVFTESQMQLFLTATM